MILLGWQWGKRFGCRGELKVLPFAWSFLVIAALLTSYCFLYFIFLQWEAQQELLKLRKASPEERERYFDSVEERRVKATREQVDKWGWQKKQYGPGEDPIDEWRKRRESGQISDLDDQYGKPEEVGGIPLPMASFGVGGEFGVGGKFDNGGRFDLRLPYAEQGWVDEDAEPFSFANLFGGSKKKIKSNEAQKKVEMKPESDQPQKNGFWPF